MKGYVVVLAFSLSELVERVNSRREKGYSEQGGVFAIEVNDRLTYHQAMVLKD